MGKLPPRALQLKEAFLSQEIFSIGSLVHVSLEHLTFFLVQVTNEHFQVDPSVCWNGKGSCTELDQWLSSLILLTLTVNIHCFQWRQAKLMKSIESGCSQTVFLVSIIHRWNLHQSLQPQELEALFLKVCCWVRLSPGRSWPGFQKGWRNLKAPGTLDNLILSVTHKRCGREVEERMGWPYSCQTGCFGCLYLVHSFIHCPGAICGAEKKGSAWFFLQK